MTVTFSHFLCLHFQKSFTPCLFTYQLCLYMFYLFQTEQFTVLWVLFAVIVLGNSAVLVTMFLNKSQKSRMNFFIKQLALAGKWIIFTHFKITYHRNNIRDLTWWRTYSTFFIFLFLSYHQCHHAISLVELFDLNTAAPIQRPERLSFHMLIKGGPFKLTNDSHTYIFLIFCKYK